MASTAVESSGASIDALKEGQACQTPIPSDAKLGRFFRPSVVDLEGQEREGRARAYLEEQAHWAAGLLGDLIEGKAAGEYDRLNAQVLNSCEGLSFIDVRKGGFGLTVGHGYGFVIKKLSQDHHGNSLWSQPLFFMVSQAGLGVSAGYQHCQSVIALLSIGSVDIFKNGTRSLGTELGLFSTDGALMGMSGGAALGASQHLGISVANTHSAFCYSKVDGVYLELSMHGSSVTPDGESNRALYGDNYNPEEVLSRRGEALPSLLPLLRTINTYGKMAMAGRPVQPEAQATA